MPKELRWNDVTLWAGEKCHIVHYPLKGGDVFNLVVTYHNDVKVPVAGVPVPVETVRQGFEHVAPRAQKIIEHGTDWKMWVLCDRDPIDRWVEGRVALLGDAAHPTLQYFAQGACMAIEDGVCIGNLIHRHGADLPSAFNAYQSERLVRTARVQVGSRLIGDHIYHPKGANALVRDAMMQSLGDDGFYDFMSWLYDKQRVAA
jgi:salicylate hydroxylase